MLSKCYLTGRIGAHSKSNPPPSEGSHSGGWLWLMFPPDASIPQDEPLAYGPAWASHLTAWGILYFQGDGSVRNTFNGFFPVVKLSPWLFFLAFMSHAHVFIPTLEADSSSIFLMRCSYGAVVFTQPCKPACILKLNYCCDCDTLSAH